MRTKAAGCTFVSSSIDSNSMKTLILEAICGEHIHSITSGHRVRVTQVLLGNEACGPQVQPRSAPLGLELTQIIQLIQRSPFLPGASEWGVCSESELFCSSAIEKRPREQFIKSWQAFSVQGQLVNTVGFAGHTQSLFFYNLLEL